MSKRSDDQRKAMFANLNKGGAGKKKSKRLKRAKHLGSIRNRGKASTRKISKKGYGYKVTTYEDGTEKVELIKRSKIPKGKTIKKLDEYD